MSDDNREMLSARIPEELKALVDADQRTNQEVVEAALWREFGGQRKAALQRRIEEKQRRVSMIESEKNERERELEEERKELVALEKKLESQSKQEKQKESALDDILSDMDSMNSTMHAAHPRIDKLARQWFDGDNQSAFLKLQERAECCEHEVAPDQFTEEP